MRQKGCSTLGGIRTPNPSGLNGRPLPIGLREHIYDKVTCTRGKNFPRRDLLFVERVQERGFEPLWTGLPFRLPEGARRWDQSVFDLIMAVSAYENTLLALLEE